MRSLQTLLCLFIWLSVINYRITVSMLLSLNSVSLVVKYSTWKGNGNPQICRLSVRSVCGIWWEGILLWSLLTCGICPNSGWLVSELSCSSQLRLEDNTSRQANSKIMCENCCVIAKSCPTLLWPHGLYSLPYSSVNGIFQARILEWDTISFSRGSS